MADPIKNANGWKALTGGMLVLAIIGGVYAMVKPMGQRAEHLNDRILELKQDLQEHAAIRAHTGMAEDSGTFRQMFTEVETQFADLDRRVGALEEWQVWWNRSVADVNAVQEERLRWLEAATVPWMAAKLDAED